MKRGSPWDELLTVIFMAIAIGAIICYFAVDNAMIYIALGGGAVLLRIVQYILRFFSKK